MDRFIAALPVVVDNFEIGLTSKGIAYQVNPEPIKYNGEYFDIFASYRNSDISKKINHCRVELVKRHYEGTVLDIGIGAGEFIENRPDTFGFDINEKSIKWLKDRDLYRETLDFGGFTFWDSLEHIPDPGYYLENIRYGSCVFVTIPVVEDLSKIRESKHYRPNEHLYYFTEDGFIYYMSLYNFQCLEVNDNEVEAGRESVRSFAFKKWT